MLHPFKEKILLRKAAQFSSGVQYDLWINDFNTFSYEHAKNKFIQNKNHKNSLVLF